MIEAHPSNDNEVRRFRLRMTADTYDFDQALLEYTQLHHRPRLDSGLFLYSQMAYRISGEPSAEEADEWSAYKERVGDIGIFTDFNVQRQTPDGKGGARQREVDGNLYVRINVMLGRGAARSLITSPIFNDELIAQQLRSRTILPMVYTVPVPVVGEERRSSLLNRLQQNIDSDKGAWVNELTVVEVGSSDYRRPVIQRPPREHTDRLPRGLAQSPDNDDAA